ncbi:MAG TPA: hypothetical protein V6C85_29620 [Allocoleopsis sp.]
MEKVKKLTVQAFFPWSLLPPALSLLPWSLLALNLLDRPGKYEFGSPQFKTLQF